MECRHRHRRRYTNKGQQRVVDSVVMADDNVVEMLCFRVGEGFVESCEIELEVVWLV